MAPRRSTPPAHLDSRLVEEIVHGEDIRQPLGLTRRYPQDAIIRALVLQARTPASLGGAKELLTRVQVTTTDAAISLGEGPQVRGTALSLLLAISGRPADLEGPGAAHLVKIP